MEKNIGENGVVWYLFEETRCPFLDTFFEIYRNDRMHAKVIYSNNKAKFSYSITRDVLFEFPNGDFKITRFVRKFGMSKTNIVYNRESADWSLTYKKATKKFYVIRGKKITQASFNSLLNVLAIYGVKMNDNEIYKYLVNKFGWLRNIQEDSRLYSLTFNVIMSKKLFNIKKALSHIYKVPYPVANIISSHKSVYSTYDFVRVWKQMLPNLINVENLKKEFFEHHLFIDACRLGSRLGYKVNCSWSLNRLKLEHDKWSKENDAIIMKYEPVIELNIAEVYKDFCKFSGYEMLTTNHELINEGRIMRHCVGSYTNNVNNGTSCIFRVDGHTLEVNYRRKYNNTNKNFESVKTLNYGQLKGVNNSQPPSELDERVKDMIINFNNHIKNVEYKQHVNNIGYVSNHVEVFGDLPF